MRIKKIFLLHFLCIFSPISIQAKKEKISKYETTSKEKTKVKKIKDNKKSEINELPLSIGDMYDSRWNEMVDFIYWESYDTAYQLALKRLYVKCFKKAYESADKAIKVSSLAISSKTKDLTSYEFKSMYAEAYDHVKNDIWDDAKKIASRYSAGYQGLDGLVTEVLIHYSVYRVIMNHLMEGRKE